MLTKIEMINNHVVVIRKWFSPFFFYNSSCKQPVLAANFVILWNPLDYSLCTVAILGIT